MTGAMLQRIRNEFRLTSDAYRLVFELSVDHVTNTGWEDDAELTDLKKYVSESLRLCVILIDCVL